MKYERSQRPIWAYHGTEAVNVPSVCQEGLIPRFAWTPWADPELNPVEERITYFTPSESWAWQHSGWGDGGDTDAVFRFPWPAEAEVEVAPAANRWLDYATRRRVPPERLEYRTGESGTWRRCKGRAS